MCGMECYVQHMEDWNLTPKDIRESYDSVVFYNMHMALPPEEGAAWYESQVRTSLGQLGDTEQGLVVLHHALLAFPESEIWSGIVGMADRSFGYYMEQVVTFDIADPEHPITAGLSGWTMTDETYTMPEAGGGNRVLITTEHSPSVRTIAWTRQYRNSRVFCFQCGHDNLAYSDPAFREVLSRGIAWSARAL
jgi:type 1 glutamine amidotransferase